MEYHSSRFTYFREIVYDVEGVFYSRENLSLRKIKIIRFVWSSTYPLRVIDSNFFLQAVYVVRN
jgi:hypothetical protein